MLNTILFGVFIICSCQNSSIYFAPVSPYRNYIAWLQQEDLKAAQLFWQQQLTGFIAPTQLYPNKLTPKAVQIEKYEQ